MRIGHPLYFPYDMNTIKVLKPREPKFKQPKPFIGFDIETDPNDKHRVLCICIKNDEFKKVFYSTEEFIAEISHKKYRGYHFIATNLPFDFFGVFQDYPEHISMVERNGRIYKLTFHQHTYNGIRKHNIHFYDTLNYFPASVQALGDILNQPKFEHPSFFPNKPQSPEQWNELVDYCYQDAYISYKFMQDIYVAWLRENKLQFKTTMASTALIDFRTNDLKKPLYVKQEFHNIIFAAYYGGRTETFRRGLAKNVYCYDFNSLYPSCMCGMMPDPNSAKHNAQMTQYYIDNYNGFTYVDGYQADTFIPVLPVKNEGRLIFPTGHIKGFYSHIEIRKAQANGFTVHAFGEGVFYTKEIDLFTSYVQRHYSKRLEYKAHKNPLEVMEKLAMNSLYGKFGFNYRETSTYQHKDQKIDLKNWETTTIVPTGDYFYIKAQGNEIPTSYSFPELSAHITAKARLKLYDELQKNKESILYCDTDSIFIQHEAESRTELGLLKLEKGYPKKKCVFIRGKFYKIDDKIKCKGVTRMSIYQWRRVMQGKKIQQKRFIKYRTAMRSHIVSTGVKRMNEEYVQKKLLGLEDTKRVWDKAFSQHELQTSKPIQL